MKTFYSGFPSCLFLPQNLTAASNNPSPSKQPDTRCLFETHFYSNQLLKTLPSFCMRNLRGTCRWTVTPCSSCTHSAGREGLPKEVLTASLPLSRAEQWPAGGSGGSFQVDMKVVWFFVKVVRFSLQQSLVLLLQEVREQQLCQGGPGVDVLQQSTVGENTIV